MSSSFAGDPGGGAAAVDGGRDARGWLGVGEVRAEGVEDFARDAALEAAHDLALGLWFPEILARLADDLIAPVQGVGCADAPTATA
jgi:hypothetical protein